MQEVEEEEESVEERYQKMSKHEKLALLMIALGEDAASTLLKRFDSKDSESICKRIGDFAIVDQELKDCVLDEFSEIIESSVNSNLGGLNFAQKTLELAHGDYKANNMMNRIAPVRDSLDFMDDIKEMDPGQIYNVLRFEQPQTIAFVLANVDADKGSEVLQMMPPNIQEQVIERVGAMETTPMDQIEVVANTLGSRMGKKGQSPRVKTGGVKSAAELLNWFDKDEGKELLKSIEKRNPKLGGSIRQRMFRFEDLVRLSAGDISKITKEVDQDDLVIAMKTENKKKSYEQGKLEASDYYQKEIKKLREDYASRQNALLASIQQKIDGVLDELNTRLPKLVVNTTESVLGSIQLDAEMIESLVKSMIEDFNDDQESLEVFLSKDDLGLLKSLSDKDKEPTSSSSDEDEGFASAIAGIFDGIDGDDALLEGYPNVKFFEDASLQSGDCQVKSRFGLLDGRIATKLRRLEEEIQGD